MTSPAGLSAFVSRFLKPSTGTQTRALPALLSMALAATPWTSSFAQKVFTFDDGTKQGWSASNPLRGGDFGGYLHLRNSGGDHQGYLQAQDTKPGHGSLAVLAPELLSGNLQRFASVSWDTWLPYGAISSTSLLVQGKDGTFYRSSNALLEPHPTQTWFTKTEDFDEASRWTQLRGSAPFDTVMQDAVAVYIELDVFWGEALNEARLDNVVIDSKPSPDPKPKPVGIEAQFCPDTGFANFDLNTVKRVRSFGDSFSAGTGFSASVQSYDNMGCLRKASVTPAARLANWLGISSINHACQNASVAAVWNQMAATSFEASGQHDLIVVTAGGNDLRVGGSLNWSNTILRCVTNNFGPCDATLRQSGENFDLVQRHLEIAYGNLARRAPLAQIRVLGYPELFQPEETRCQAVPGLSRSELLWFDELSRQLNERARRAVDKVQRATGANLEFVDVSAEFAGHGVCSDSNYIRSPSPFDFLLSRYSPAGTWMHPTTEGYRAYYRALGKSLLRCAD